jgi:hypothetical protein
LAVAGAEELHQVLASSAAPLLGVIANESKSGGPIPYPKMTKSYRTSQESVMCGNFL